MNLPAPLLLLAGPLVPALVSLLLRPWPRLSAGAGALGALVLWRWVTVVSLAEGAAGVFAGPTLTVLGRALTLMPGVQIAFGLMYAGLTVLMLLALGWRQSQDFAPASFLVLAVLAGAAMARPFSFGVLLLLVAAAGTTIIIQSDRAGATDAALRYLVFVALATPLFLVAGWMLDSAQASLQGTIWGLLLVGTTLLLAGFPFIIWVRPLVVTGSSLTPAFVFGLVSLGQLTFLLALMGENPWLFGVEAFSRLLAWSGLLTLVLGGVLAVSSRLRGNLLGALLLVDLGGTLGLLALGEAGMAPAVAGVPARFLALALAGSGAALMARDEQSDVGSLDGRVGLAAFAFGGLSLIGLPLTPGFTVRWPLLLALADAAGPAAGAGAVTVALAGMTLGVAGLARYERRQGRVGGVGSLAAPIATGHARLTPLGWATLLLAVATAGLALWPAGLLRQAARLAAGL